MNQAAPPRLEEPPSVSPRLAPADSGDSPQMSSDAALVASIRAGHPSSAARLFDRCGGEINRVVLRVLGGDSDHDDLVHDVFLKVWGLLEKGAIRNPDALSAWVSAVTTHTLYKELRRRYLRRRIFLRDEPPPSALARVSDEESRELLQIVYRLLAELPPDERLALSLRYLDQRKLEEVAALCECSLATAKRRLSRAEARFVALAKRYPDMPRLNAFVASREEEP